MVGNRQPKEAFVTGLVPKVRGVMSPTGKQVIVICQCCLLDLLSNYVFRRWSDFKLNRLCCLLLHDDRTGGNSVTMADITHPQADEATCPDLAVQSEIQER